MSERANEAKLACVSPSPGRNMSKLVSLPSALGIYVKRERARGASCTRNGGRLYFDAGSGDKAADDLDGAAAAAAPPPMVGAAAAGPDEIAVVHAGRCVGQCALWHVREQYDMLLQRPHLLLAGVPEHCAHTELMLNDLAVCMNDRSRGNF